MSHIDPRKLERSSGLRYKGSKRLENLHKLMALTEKQLGENNEKRVMWAFTQGYPWDKPIPWLRAVRRGTRREDQFEGIDVVFMTDVGDIGVQVKSSAAGRARFVLRQVRGEVSRNIVPVYINPSFDTETICRIVTKQVAAERKRRQFIGDVPGELKLPEPAD